MTDPRWLLLLTTFVFVLLAIDLYPSAPTQAAAPAQADGHTQRNTPTSTPRAGCAATPPRGTLRASITEHSATTAARFVNRSLTCSYPIGLAVYRDLDGRIAHQQLYDYRLVVIPPNSTLTLTANNPPCAFQSDAFYGALIRVLCGRGALWCPAAGRRQGPPGATLRGQCDRHADPHAGRPHSDSDRDADEHPHCHGDAHADRHAHRHADQYSHADTDQYAYQTRPTRRPAPRLTHLRSRRPTRTRRPSCPPTQTHPRLRRPLHPPLPPRKSLVGAGLLLIVFTRQRHLGSKRGSG